MSAIAATGSSSSYSAVAQLLANSLSSAASGIPQIGQSSTSGSSATSTSASSDNLNLSDHAKAVLARAKTDKVAANELQAFLQSAKNPSGTGNASASKPTSDDGTQLFDQLTGRTQSQPSGDTTASPADPVSANLNALVKAHTLPDGSVTNFSVNVSNVLNPVSTPQDIADWYNTNATSLINDAQSSPSESTISLAQAVQNHQVTFQSAADIPGLNFHNTYTYQGGEDGASANETFTYNQSAAIFQDPTTNYLVWSNGTVISWKNTLPSTPASSS
jgi:hypothetical protein